MRGKNDLATTAPSKNIFWSKCSSNMDQSNTDSIKEAYGSRGVHFLRKSTI